MLFFLLPFLIQPIILFYFEFLLLLLINQFYYFIFFLHIFLLFNQLKFTLIYKKVIIKSIKHPKQKASILNLKDWLSLNQHSDDKKVAKKGQIKIKCLNNQIQYVLLNNILKNIFNLKHINQIYNYIDFFIVFIFIYRIFFKLTNRLQKIKKFKNQIDFNKLIPLKPDRPRLRFNQKRTKLFKIVGVVFYFIKLNKCQAFIAKIKLKQQNLLKQFFKSFQKQISTNKDLD
ncbi:transmembrane protein, putative (macronuclear) [Tetrahymena thermophila SB210]|uniref:Transmembrane protein, putative n=1 Tax=Tetrahymena thermophila (strain SB210) TaxID=312017 RepID=W7XJA2_TETTS|nr:transmembrane protein, putative [Tetrahymena thermophila SB210]EWS75341.1 transmembrane protein, putative [Tetrahymena thermophila SB210]|eukprot:XP_012652130.1 transmembrane protein, putative [Tetrahymena thermophila SB210]